MLAVYFLAFTSAALVAARPGHLVRDTEPSPAVEDQVSPPATETPTWRKVLPGVKWQNLAWCGYGSKCTEQPIPEDATFVSVDLFDTPTHQIKELAQKYTVSCAFSAGRLQQWRPDANSFPDSVKGIKVQDWEETWLDIRQLEQLKPLLQARLDLAKSKGCHGVELGDVDCWQSDCVADVKHNDPDLYTFQLEQLRWLSNYAHSVGLGVGFLNNLNQAKELVEEFDWAVVESCHAYSECQMTSPFIEQNKAVLALDYRGDKEKICKKAKELQLSQKVNNDGLWEDC